MEDRSSKGELNVSWDLEKWNMLVFPCSTISPYFERRDKMIL